LDEQTKSRQENGVATQDAYIARLKAQGAAIADIHKAELDLAAEKAKNAKSNFTSIKDEEAAVKNLEVRQQLTLRQIRERTEATEKYNKLVEQTFGGSFALTGQEKLAGQKIFIEQTEELQKEYDNLTASITRYRDAEKEVTKTQDEVIQKLSEIQKEELIDAAKLATEKAKLQVTLAENAGKKLLDLQKAEIKAEAEERITAVKISGKDAEEQEVAIAAIKAEANKRSIELIRAYRVKVLEEAKAAFDAEVALGRKSEEEKLSIKLQDLQRQAVIDKNAIKDSEFAAQERANIDKKYAAEVELAKREFNDKAREEDFTAQQALIQARLSLAKKGSAEEFKAQNELILAEQAAQINNAKTTITNKTLLDAELVKIDAETKKKLIDADKAKAQYDAGVQQQNISALQSHAEASKDLIMSDPHSANQDKVNALKVYYEQSAQNIKDLQQLNEEAYDKDLETLDEYLNKKRELEDKAAKEKQDGDLAIKKQQLADVQEVAKEAVKLAQNVSNEIFATANANRNRNYDLEISRLQKQSSFELNNHNLTEAQKIAIQRKFDKEVAAVKLQQWKADQQSKEEQAVINGALAVVNILATMPWTSFGVTQAIAIGSAVAATAAQVAVIGAQKPPAFAKGTPKGTPDTLPGMKLVGEQGPELIYTGGGDRIITAPDTAALLAKYDVPALPNVSEDVMMRANLQVAQPMINEDRLAKKIAEAVGEQTRPLVEMNKSGFQTYLVNKGGKTQILNNRTRWD